MSAGEGTTGPPALTQRQEVVLRAVVAAYVGEAAPVGSATLAHLLPVSLSSATIRNTMAELTELGLVEKPHASAGRLPTERGLRLFVDQLLGPRRLEDWEKRAIAERVAPADPEGLLRTASQALSEHTRQLGFVVVPRLERIVLRHLTLVRLSSERVLAVLVSQTGVAYRRVLEDDGAGDQHDLDRIAAALNERVAGRTLAELREVVAGEASALRSLAQRLRERAACLATQALAPDGADPGDLLIATRLALLDQPEFRDPERVRGLFEAIETRERLIAILDQMLAARGVRVAFGQEIGEPALRHCALVASCYGGADAPLGMLGVLGPSRMDYARVISLVDYLSQLVTQRLRA